MTQKRIPNIFKLLEIDPDHPWDQAFYEQQLETKRKEWAKISQLPTDKGKRAKINLDYLPDIKRIACDEGLRNSQAVEARQDRRREKAEKLKELSEHLELLQAKDYLLQEEFYELVAHYMDIIGESELRQLVNVEIRKEAPKTLNNPEILDATIARKINSLLNILHKTDLYDFLGLPKITETKILYEKSHDFYTDIFKQAYKRTEDSLTSELCGFCLKIFSSEQGRKQYDEYLRLAKYDEIKQKIDQASHITHKLYREQITLILRFASEKRLDPIESLLVIIGHSQDKGYTICLP